MFEQLTMFEPEKPVGGALEPLKPTEIKLINDDCYEAIKHISDGSVDLVIIDPPYEFVANTGSGAFGNKNRSYHADYAKVYHENTPLGRRKKNNLSDLDNLCHGFDLSILDECCRVLKKINMYVWCSKGQVSQLLNYFENKGCFTDILTWHKTNPVPTCNGTYLNDTEYLIFARQKGVKVYGTYKTKFKYYVTPLNQKEKRLYKHPTIKPVFIIENLIINSSLEGDTVLDCFMGSGTTGVACKNTNRNFIGIEISDEYFAIAQRRINGEQEAN